MSSNFLRALRERSASLVPPRLRKSYHLRKTDRLEREHLLEFQEFYSRLTNQQEH